LIKDQRHIYLIPDDGGLPQNFGVLIKKCVFLKTKDLLVFFVTEAGTYLGGGGEWCGCAR